MFLVTTPENQTQFIVPTNPTTQTIYYNQRLLVSDNPINPIAWEVTKIESLIYPGVTYVTLKQDLYDSAKDNPELMVADYYASKVTPLSVEDEHTEDDDLLDITDMRIKHNGNPTIKVGGSYKIFTVDTDKEYDKTKVSWQLSGAEPGDYSVLQSYDTYKLKSAKVYALIGKVYTLDLYYDGKIKDSIKVEVISL